MIETQCPLETRILQVLRHLGITQAHVVANMTPDWRGIATGHSDLLSSLTLVCPMSLDPHDVSAFASRLLVFTGDQGPQPERLRRERAPPKFASNSAA